MTGSAKQIKLAEEIIENAKKNLEYMSEATEKFGTCTNCHAWKYAKEDVETVAKDLEMIAVQITDAGMIIDRREMFSRNSLEAMACESYFKRTGTRF